MENGINPVNAQLYEGDKHLWNITGYGKFGTLYLLSVEEMERLLNDLECTLNKINSSLSSEQLAKITEASLKGTLAIKALEEEDVE